MHKSSVGGSLQLFTRDFDVPLEAGEREVGLVYNFGDVVVPFEVTPRSFTFSTSSSV